MKRKSREEIKEETRKEKAIIRKYLPWLDEWLEPYIWEAWFYDDKLCPEWYKEVATRTELKELGKGFKKYKESG